MQRDTYEILAKERSIFRISFYGSFMGMGMRERYRDYKRIGWVTISVCKVDFGRILQWQGWHWQFGFKWKDACIVVVVVANN